MDNNKGFDGINIKLEALDDQLPYPDLGLTGNEMFSHNGLFLGENHHENGGGIKSGGDIEEEDDDDDDVIILHIDIRHPIRLLRTMLEQRIGVDLSNYEFWLQDAQQLEPHKNLVDQCVKGEGLVQVNAQVRINTKRINIVDVLKPMDDATVDLDDDAVRDGVRSRSVSPDAATMAAAAAIERELAAVPGHPEDSDDVMGRSPIDIDEDDSNLDAPPPQKPQWIIDTQFKKEQSRLKISEDPRDWTLPQVKHWLQWAVRQFNLTNIKLQDWQMTGKELYDMTLEEFHQKVPIDPDNIFYTHLELLRRLKVAAIPGELTDHDDYNEDMMPVKSNRTIIGGRQMIMKSTIKPLGLISQYSMEAAQSAGNRTGNNGQIQLWQFLLEILTDREHRDIISWMGTGGQGEFKLSDPERVARLWGERKNKPTMNYEKLSRALRYYYDGDMISKVHGKRFVYKFVCDLTQLIGYSAQELAQLVNEEPAAPTASDLSLFNSLKDFVAE